MKRMRFLVTVALTFVWFAALSAPRNFEQARKTAHDFYVQNAKTKAALSDEDFVLVYPRAAKNGTAQAPLYVFNLSNQKGFVMVNGDDDLRPVLGYSLSGGFPTDALPSNLQYWLDTYRQQIEAYQEAVKNGTMTGDMEFSNAYPKTDATTVGPLLENYEEGAINYDQGAPYNLFCPDPDETGYPAVSGCVATALTQIARYHKHPAQGTGHIAYTSQKFGIDIEHDFTDTYDWENMLCDYNGNMDSYTQEQKEAIATLMRDIGYASQMNYGYVESWAYHVYALGGMQQHLGYSKASEIVYRGFFTDKQWTDLLTAELDAGRPVYYGGSDFETNTGHAFVCDGYKADNYFHFNWGWGSWGNGWYWINNLVPSQTGTGAGSGHYNDDQSVFVKFKPDEGEAPVAGIMGYQDNGHAPDKRLFACETDFYEKDAPLSCKAYDFFNLSPYVMTVDIGVVYWNQDGSFVKAVLTSDNQSLELQTNYGWHWRDFTINPGKDVPTGTYKISLGFRPAGSSQWEEIKALHGYTCAYTVIVQEDVYNVKKFQNVQVETPYIDQPDGMFLDSMEVAITCTTPGASILYSLNGSAPSLPYTRTLVLKESATLRAIAVKEGMEASNEARAVYNCVRDSLKKYTSVANLRELRENGENGIYYRVTGQVTVTFASSNFWAVHVEDSTGGMQIYDMAGLYRTKCRIGDVLENVCGRFKINEYSDNLLEIPEGEVIPAFDPVTQVIPRARKASMEQIKQNRDAYSSTLVEIENVRLANWEDGVVWTSDYNYDAYQGDEAFFICPFYTSGESYLNKRIPQTFTLRGIVRDGMLFPRTKNDIRGEGDPLPAIYTLTVDASPSEGGTVSGGGTYESGMEITLRAKAADEWKFVRWSDNNTKAIRTVTVTGDATYTAYFRRADAPEEYTLTVIARPKAGGTVYGGGIYESGKEVTLSAKAKSGWKFTRWGDNNTQATRTVTVTEDATYAAYFEPLTDRETESLSEIKIYPNPSEGLFIVETDRPLKAEVYDNLGLSRGTYQWNNAGKHTVDLRPCAPGVYHLRLASSTSTQTVKLVVR